jgi:hypothetical protein
LRKAGSRVEGALTLATSLGFFAYLVTLAVRVG